MNSLGMAVVDKLNIVDIHSSIKVNTFSESND